MTMEGRTFSGLVGSVDNELLSFQLDTDQTIFYTGLWTLSHKKAISKSEDKVTVNLCADHKTCNGKVIILCERCEMSSGKTVRIDDDHLLLNIMENYTLGQGFLLKLHQLHTKLQEHIEAVAANVNVGKIIIEIAIGALKNSTDPQEFNVKPISSFKIVDGTNEMYRKLPYWIYAVNRKLADNEYILGRLRVHDNYGVLLLSDAEWFVPVITFKNRSVGHLLNQFVLIRKAVMIAEVYNADDIAPTSCLLVDVDDIISLESVPTLSVDSINVSGRDVTMKSKIIFDVLHIGPICFGQNEKIQCWLEAKSNILGKIYVVLEGPLVQLRSLVSVNRKYTLFYNKQRTPVFWHEVCRLNNVPAYLFNDPQSKIVDNGISGADEPEIMDVARATEYLQSHCTLANITGTIKNKIFRSGCESYFGGKRRQQPFGTPGNHTHIIHLETNNDGNLSLFLNDFNRYLAPFCLIPGMVVNFYKVMPQSKRYYKCTALTTFEVVDCKIERDTAFLNTNRNWNIKERTFLSLEHTTFYNAIFLSRLKTVTVNTCNLKYDRWSGNLEIQISLKCTDEFGPFSLIVNSKNVLKKLLGFSDFSYNVFLKAFEKAGEYHYDAASTSQEAPQDEAGNFKRALNLLLHGWHFYIFDIPIHVKKWKVVENVPEYVTVDI